MAANRAWNLNWPESRLLPIAAKLGSDVPFFIRSRPAVCRGRGEQLEWVTRFPRLSIVVAKPTAGLSTPEVYRACQPQTASPQLPKLLDAAARGNAFEVGRYLVNGLEKPACALSPVINTMRAAFARTDCLAHQMSGSGTSYFGICRNRRHARRVANRLRGTGIAPVYCTQTILPSRLDAKDS